MVIVASQEHASEIALFHEQGLVQGFLRKLGFSFLTSMYKYLIKHELVYVYIEEAKIKGFVSASLSTGQVMRRFVTNSPSGIINILIAVLKTPSLLKSIFETYKSSHTLSSNPSLKLPSVELLSIVVSKNAQQSGVGSLLLLALENKLKSLGIQQYKVVAGEKLTGANRFYLKNGFEKVAQIIIHDEDISNVYVKELITQC